MTTIMVRLTGEVATKGRRTRRRFQKALVRNIRGACRSAGIEAEVADEWSRLFVRSEDDGVEDVLARVFGISSYSTVEAECEADLKAIVRTGRELFAERVRGHTYAVRARRSGTHSFCSQDVRERLGAALNPGARVDLRRPEVEACVEVRDDRALLYSQTVRGPGGLPLGVEGKAVCLISGGFDSAVAAWMVLRRGVALDYVFCNLGGAAYRRMAVDVARVVADLWSHGTRPHMHVLDFGPVVADLRRAGRPALLQVLLKRQMVRAASRIGTEIGADAIVTGEAVGQVSSQTLANLRAIESAAALPILRPLVGFDKEEIIRRSKEIGTHELSARVREYCSITEGHPATAARVEVVERDEGNLDPAVLERALEEAQTFNLRDADPAACAGASLFLENVPPDAVVIDTRDAEPFRGWHWPGAVRRPFEELMRSHRDLDRERSYLLVCEQGLKSAQVAERMQADGYEAYSFLGGVPRLRRLAARAGAGSGGMSEAGE
ncbi:MAG: tRNA uracil 4-sulfurtransferase ThiI [Gemmatimonadota bacterium]